MCRCHHEFMVSFETFLVGVVMGRAWEQQRMEGSIPPAFFFWLLLLLAPVAGCILAVL